MEGVLKGKHIVLGVTGGIAAYKAASLVRLFIKAGAEVQVIMTPAAKEFITPLTLSTLSRNPVISEFFTANTGEWHSHVDLGLWADCFIVAPATANTIGKMVGGIADNMLVTSYLSTRAKVFVAPAMDFDMMRHPSTARNIETLSSWGTIIIEPEAGELASGLTGKGRMAEPEKIFSEVEQYLSRKHIFAGKEILITAGPTFEKIDPVRFIGNYSTGKMGFALAEAAAKMGARVTLVSGPVALNTVNGNISQIKVESAKQMLEACLEFFPKCDIAIMAAAVADYRPEVACEKKIKRGKAEELSIQLVKNPDIAAMMGDIKKSGQILVGFALETDNEHSNAREKIKRKNLDFIILNSLNDAGAGFGVDTNKVTVFSKDGQEWNMPLRSKTDLAFDILELIDRFTK